MSFFRRKARVAGDWEKLDEEDDGKVEEKGERLASFLLPITPRTPLVVALLSLININRKLRRLGIQYLRMVDISSRTALTTGTVV